MVEEIVVCVATFTAAVGKFDELKKELSDLIKPTRSEEGCIRYELNEDVTEGMLVFIEKWKGQKVFTEHCEKPYIKNFFLDVAPKLVAKQDVRLYTEIGGEI